MKRILILMLALAAICFSCGALAEQADQNPILLDHTTIIDGDLIYYSGSIDGGESGVYVMNADGSDARLISGVTADLVALSGSNLLIYQYDIETGDICLAILLPDGTLIPLAESYGGAGIAADGRFYWGVASCAEDGSDMQVYFTGDAVKDTDYYPLQVYEGYLYYLDWGEMSGKVISEGNGQPLGAELWRMNLTDHTAEMISGAGSRFIGIEGDSIYYTRETFWTFDEQTYSSSEITVDRGLFSADLTLLHETRLAELASGDAAVESYVLIEDGAVYGMRCDQSSSADAAFSILRVPVDGSGMTALPVTGSDSWMTICYADNGILYAAESSILASEDDFIQQDCILAINTADNSITPLNPNSIDMLFYSELNPAVVAANGRIYYSAYDMERWSVCLKSMNPDGTDVRLLAHGISYAEG